MSTVALQNIWDTLLGYNLSTANKRWLAEHLWEQIMVETAEQVPPGEKIYETTFRVRGTVEMLRALKRYLEEGGYQYESV